MDGSVIREVVIKTRIEHERSKHGPRAGGDPSEAGFERLPSSSDAAARKTTAAMRTKVVLQKQLLTLSNQEIQQLQAIEKQRSAINKAAQKNKAYTAEMLDTLRQLALEEQRVSLHAKAAQNQARLSLEIEKRRLKVAQDLERTRAKNAFKPNSQMSGAGAADLTLGQRVDYHTLENRYRKVLEYSKQIAVVDVGAQIQVEKILSRIAKRKQDILNTTKKAGGAGFAGGMNAFGTGIPALDELNKKMFAAFITQMSVVMIGSFAKSMAEGLAGLSGEGDGVVAGLSNFVRGNQRATEGSVYKWAKGTGGGMIRGLSDLGLAVSGGLVPGIDQAAGRQQARNFAESSGYGLDRRDMVSRSDSLSSEFEQALMRTLTTAQREEDKMIQEKRAYLREEIDALRMRAQAAQAEANQAIGRREGVIQDFGNMTAVQQRKTLEIFRDLEANKMPSGQRRAFMNQHSAIFGEINSAFAHNAANAGGVDKILNSNVMGARFNQDVFAAQRQAQQANLAAKEFELNPVFNIQLNIEQLEIEVKEMVDQLNDALVPVFEDIRDELTLKIREEIKFLRDEFKAGRIGGGIR